MILLEKNCFGEDNTRKLTVLIFIENYIQKQNVRLKPGFNSIRHGYLYFSIQKKQ